MTVQSTLMVGIENFKASTTSYFPLLGAELVDTITVGFARLRQGFRFSHHSRRMF